MTFTPGNNKDLEQVDGNNKSVAGSGPKNQTDKKKESAVGGNENDATMDAQSNAVAESAMSSEDLEELAQAQKKMEKKAKKMEKKRIEKMLTEEKNKRDDELLKLQQKAAIEIIKEAAVYEKNIELVRDDSYNDKMMTRISSVELKIDQLDLIFTQLLSRGRYVGREQEVLPMISSVLQLIVQLFLKVNLEAFRIGVLNR